MKYLIWIALLILVFWFIRPRVKTKSRTSNTATSSSTDKPTTSDTFEAMVSCSHCGLYLPASEAVAAVSGAVYCSDEHRRLHVER